MSKYGESDADIKREDYNSLYGGPRSGTQSSADDADLHNNGLNPYAAGGMSPRLRTDEPQADPTDGGFTLLGGSGSMGQYYMNPPTDLGNDYSGGAGHYKGVEHDLTGSIASGLDAVYGDVMSNRQPAADAPDPYSDPYQQNIRRDTAQDEQLLPPGQRR